MAELDELIDLLVLDYDKIDLDQVDGKARTPLLESIRNQLIRSEVIMLYCLLDELLGTAICRYFFGRKKSTIDLWKTKKFKIFNYHIVEELSLLQKLRLLKEKTNIPKHIVKDIEKLNSLRNGIAHTFFPENLKRNKPVYKGIYIFSMDGIKRLKEDMKYILEFFEQISGYRTV